MVYTKNVLLKDSHFRRLWRIANQRLSADGALQM
jgi:hypothetical protein